MGITLKERRNYLQREIETIDTITGIKAIAEHLSELEQGGGTLTGAGISDIVHAMNPDVLMHLAQKLEEACEENFALLRKDETASHTPR